MQMTNQYEGQLVEVGHYEKALPGGIVVYSLLTRAERGKRQYAISVSRGAERESCILGFDLFSAVSFFKKIVEGEVFPYSLSELVEDFWQEMKKYDEESA